MKAAFLNPIYWKKSVLAILLSAFVLVWFGFVDSYSLLTRLKLNNQKADLKNKIEQLNTSASVLEIKINNLNQDAQLLEKIAREEYGMRKPGETVYKIRKPE